MITPDYGLRLLGSLACDITLKVVILVLVPPAAIALGVLAAFERAMPQPAGRGPARRDEY